LIRPAVPETEAQVRCPHCLAQFDVELVMWWEVPALIAVDPVVGPESGALPMEESFLPVESKTPSDVERSLPWTMLDEREPRVELLTHSDDLPEIRVPSPFAPTPPRIDRRDRHVRRRNPQWEIAKIVGGGVAGLLIAQLILWWLPAPLRRDPFGLASRVPSFLQFIVPEDQRSDALASAKWEVPKLPPVVELPDAPSQSRRPPDRMAELPDLRVSSIDDPPPSLARDSAPDLRLPSSVDSSDNAPDLPAPPTDGSKEPPAAALPPPAEQDVATPSQVDPGAQASMVEPDTPSDDVAPISPKLDEAGDEIRPATTETLTEPSAAPSIVASSALPEPQLVPPAFVGPEVAQPTATSESPTEQTTDTRPEPPAETAPEPASATELPAVATDADVTPESVAESPPDTPIAVDEAVATDEPDDFDEADELDELDKPNPEAVALARALTEAKAAVDGFVTTSPSNQPARVAAARQMYERLCELAERAAATDPSTPYAAGTVQEASAVLERIAQEPLQLRLLGRSAASWIVYPRRVSQGIALAGQVTQIRPMGPWIEVQLQLHGRPNVTMPVLMLHSATLDGSAPLELGGQLVVLGVIASQAQDDLAEYTGTFPVVRRVLHVPFGS
jgi:hypothetical protein